MLPLLSLCTEAPETLHACTVAKKEAASVIRGSEADATSLNNGNEFLHESEDTARGRRGFRRGGRSGIRRSRAYRRRRTTTGRRRRRAKKGVFYSLFGCIKSLVLLPFRILDVLLCGMLGGCGECDDDSDGEASNGDEAGGDEPITIVVKRRP